MLTVQVSSSSLVCGICMSMERQTPALPGAIFYFLADGVVGVLEVGQFFDLLKHLADPYRTMVMVAQCTGASAKSWD
jgi:hypothetical protein